LVQLPVYRSRVDRYVVKFSRLRNRELDRDLALLPGWRQNLGGIRPYQFLRIADMTALM